MHKIQNIISHLDNDSWWLVQIHNKTGIEYVLSPVFHSFCNKFRVQSTLSPYNRKQWIFPDMNYHLVHSEMFSSANATVTIELFLPHSRKLFGDKSFNFQAPLLNLPKLPFPIATTQLHSELKNSFTVTVRETYSRC